MRATSKTLNPFFWLLPVLLAWALLVGQPLSFKTASGQNSGLDTVSAGFTLWEAAPRLGFSGLAEKEAAVPLVVANRAIQVTEKGLARIEGHLSQFGDDAANAVMLQRLRTGQATQQDLNFYMHELKESAFMRQGVDARAAHEATLKWQGIPYKPGYEAQLYSKDAIQAGGTTFSPAARRAAGLE